MPSAMSSAIDAGRDHLERGAGLVAESHHRALAELLLDVGERGVERLVAVSTSHGAAVLFCRRGVEVRPATLERATDSRPDQRRRDLWRTSSRRRACGQNLARTRVRSGQPTRRRARSDRAAGTRNRQPDRQPGADVLDPDDAPVRLDDALARSRARARAPRAGRRRPAVRRARRLPAPGEVEDPVQVLLGDPAALVADAELDAVGAAPGRGSRPRRRPGCAGSRS